MEKRFNLNFVKKHSLFFVFLAALVLYVTWVWLPLGLFHSWNEAYYMMRVSHIVKGGSYFDWGFDNPPLFVYTLTALSRISLNLIFFRLFIVFSTLFSAFLVYKIGSVFADKKTGVAASAMYAFFPLIMLFSKKLQIEMFGILLMTFSFYFAVLGTEKKQQWFHVSGLFLGLTILTKFPCALVAIPILYYMYRKKVGWKQIFLTFSEAAFVSLLWFSYVWFTKPSFLNNRVSSSSNLFGLGDMHTGAPVYQALLIAIAVLTLVFLLFLFVRKKPTNVEEKTLFLFSLIFALFFFLLPNHEYYLLPMFVPLFLYIVLKFRRGQWKKMIMVFLTVSILLLASRPFYEVDWQQTTDYIKQNFSEKNITIYSSNPRVTEYYLKQNVTWLKPQLVDNFSNNSIVFFTCYDIANLKSVKLWDKIQNQLVLLKEWDGKTFVYGSENLK